MPESNYRGSNGPRPPRKKGKDDSVNWVVVIILFVMGLWPIALLYLGYRWLSDNRNGQSPEDKIRQAQERMDNAIDSVLQNAGAGTGAAQRGKGAGTRSAGAPDGSSSQTQARGTAQAKPLQKDGGKKFQVAGAILMVLGMLILSEPIDDLIWLETLRYSIEELILGLNVLAAGGVLLGRGVYLSRFSRRARKYAAAIGGADSLDIRLIAKRVGRSYEQAVGDLEKMIDKGFLGEDAYLDLDLGYFLRFGADLEQVRKDKKREEGERKTAAEETVEAKPAGEPDYAHILRNIRRANDRIAGEELSAKIDRLEQITSQILKEVAEHPEKRAKMNTFFDYYLPTTQKLLDAYADFEETGVEGENLRSAKRRIEETMDSIVEGFAHQLDQLYTADVMDVASDIKVMESMLHRDSATAAKDFDYEKYRQQP